MEEVVDEVIDIMEHKLADQGYELDKDQLDRIRDVLDSVMEEVDG